MLLFLFSTLGNPCSSFFTCSLCRDSNDLFSFDFVVELLKRGIADGDANCQLFSQLLLLKLIDPITVSLCFLLYLSLGHSPLWLGHFYTCTQYTCILRLLCYYYTCILQLNSWENKGTMLCWHIKTDVDKLIGRFLLWGIFAALLLKLRPQFRIACFGGSASDLLACGMYQAGMGISSC